MIDIRNEPSLTIVDIYTKDGTHLKRTISTESGQVVSEEGRDPSKDVVFLPSYKQDSWNRFAAKNWEDHMPASPASVTTSAALPNTTATFYGTKPKPKVKKKPKKK